MDLSLGTGYIGARDESVDCNVNIGGTGLTIIWIMVFCALVIVVARLYTQARITKQFGLSDYLMFCSITIIVGFASLISVQYHYGWGRHQKCITDVQKLETQIKFNVTGQSFGIMGSTFGRLSFIIFMLALFGSKKWVRWALWTIFVAQIVTNVGTVVAIYAQCKDPRALYDFTLPEATCWPSYVQTYLGWAHTSFNGACDAFLAVLPATMIWNLHMKTRMKVGLAVLLGMSALALVGLIMKCVYLDALSYEGDYSYNTVPMFTWIVVEGTLVAMAASIPLLRPLMKQMGKQQTKTSNSYDLPHYAIRSGHTDSSGVSKFGSKIRTSVRVSSNMASPRTLYPLDSDSDDGLLVLQTTKDNPESPEIAGLRNGRILVRQEYTVTSEAKEKGDTQNENAEVSMGSVVQSVHTRRPSSSEQYVTSIGEPRPPPSAWSRGRG
ncbi:hypothetical protein N0V93_002280 [Gnomoniopsis smithogilvyi]|uniref:Rhodopsin domain-containing protein n=1 Tax=Gnomoniopsis smithogilvyi TaxID=1191159 RepID=A0A9W9CYX4_9PEZI|nr:hypothetical protein N0V93_002280 [Gnomoniopsis smithogilvyi]